MYERPGTVPNEQKPPNGGRDRRFDCTECVDYETEYNIDFTDLDSISYRPEFCEEIEDQVQYQALSFKQECRLSSALGTVHDPQDVCQVLVPHYRWKVSSNPTEYDHPQRHEQLFKQTFDVNCEVRGDDRPSSPSNPAHRAIAGDLYCVTQVFLDRTQGSLLTVYRGLSRHASDLIAEALRAETRPTYDVRSNVLKNFTASEAFTAYYSALVFRIEIPRTAVALAADHLIKYREGGCPAECDAEYRVFGDELVSSPSEDIYLLVEGERTPLFDFLAKKDSFTGAEHRCYIDSIRHLAENDERITGDPGATRIADWYRALATDEYRYAEAIEEVVNYVVGRTNELPNGWRTEVAEVLGEKRI